eukprot:scaffold1062_cov130-Cylindrotheca_fusiformis.AAC.44
MHTRGKAKEKSPVLVCWYCGETGHTKKVCPNYHLDLAMKQLVPPNTNPLIRDAVRKKARIAIVAGIENGKEGTALGFGGSPYQLALDWPFISPPPAFPTRGVWYLGTYYGDDA